MPLARAGAPIDSARLVLVILHGMGGDQARMVMLAERIAPADVAILAPSSPEGHWWPQRFREVVPARERHLAASLAIVEDAVREALDRGVAPQEIVIAGFSQGACLALEHAARAGRPYRAVVAMTGALLGTVGAEGALRQDTAPVRYHEDLSGIPFFITTHSDDRQVPAAFVESSATILRAHGADVTVEIVPGARHEFSRNDHRNLAAALAADGVAPAALEVSAEPAPPVAPQRRQRAQDRPGRRAR